MSRPLRIQYPNAWYHIMNRGRRYEDIFADAEDYQIFVDLLKEINEHFEANFNAVLSSAIVFQQPVVCT
jgi:hypothetical protein